MVTPTEQETLDSTWIRTPYSTWARQPERDRPDHWPGRGPRVFQEEEMRTEWAALCFPSGTTGTGLLVLAPVIVAGGFVNGRSKGR